MPKDGKALIKSSDDMNVDSSILKSVEAVNMRQKSKLFQKIKKHFNGDLKGKVIGLWGLSFKPNTDDMRDAPSRILMEMLWGYGAKVQAYDPEAKEETLRIYGERSDLLLTDTKEDALKNIDAMVLCTEWKSFNNINIELLKANMDSPVVFDGRNLYDPKVMEDNGVQYYGIGRGLSVNTSY